MSDNLYHNYSLVISIQTFINWTIVFLFMNRRDFSLGFLAGAGVGAVATVAGAKLFLSLSSGVDSKYRGLDVITPNQINSSGTLIVDDLEASVLSLEKVFKNDNVQLLSNDELDKSIADNLVVVGNFDGIIRETDSTITLNNKSVGTGLQLTSDGFILTAYHCIRDYEDDWRRINRDFFSTSDNKSSWIDYMKTRYAVVDQYHNAYPIDTHFWITNPSLDIALIKAVIPQNPEPNAIRLLNRDLVLADNIKLFGFRNQRLFNQYGKVINTNYDAIISPDAVTKSSSITHDTFLTDTYGVAGFSGGAFTTLSGEFVGLALYIQREINSEIGYAGGAKARYIVKLIEQSVDFLSQSHRRVK